MIVTNHHYYGLDLASGGALLPEHEVVVFDEAHHLPEVIGATCGTDLSGGRVRTLARRTCRWLRALFRKLVAASTGA